MSNLITHIFIPFSILLIFSKELNISKKILIILSYFAVFPDMDIHLFHRATLHNVFVLFGIFCLFVFWKDIKIACIASYFMFSHILLDTFNGGTYLFNPVYNECIIIMAGVSYLGSNITLIFKIIIDSTLSDQKFSEQMVSSENVATIILILIVVIVVIVVMIKNKTKYFKYLNMKLGSMRQ
jgi:hypothetical protein